jgi:alpha-beta hydrolase superfamily lysophospholipase
VKKNNKKLLWLIPIVLLIGVVGFAWYLGDSTYQGITQLSSHEKTRIEAENAYLKEIGFDQNAFLSNYHHETVVLDVTEPEPHTVTADYILANGDRNQDTVVMAHGLGGNRQTVYPTAEMFLKMGFNVLAYDQRNSGENMADTNTFGYFERLDMDAFVRYAAEQLDSTKIIGVWGVSYGATTVGMYVGMENANQQVDFAIMESPFSDASEMTNMVMSEMDLGGLPVDLLVKLGNLVMTLRAGFNLDDAFVPKEAAKASMPVLVIYSDDDTVIMPEMTKPIIDALPVETRFQLKVSGSEHIEIYADHRNDYEKAVADLIAVARERKAAE